MKSLQQSKDDPIREEMERIFGRDDAQLPRNPGLCRPGPRPEQGGPNAAR